MKGPAGTVIFRVAGTVVVAGPRLPHGNLRGSGEVLSIGLPGGDREGVGAGTAVACVFGTRGYSRRLARPPSPRGYLRPVTFPGPGVRQCIKMMIRPWKWAGDEG